LSALDYQGERFGDAEDAENDGEHGKPVEELGNPEDPSPVPGGRISSGQADQAPDGRGE
jgi:hypothetical protein